MTTFNKYIIDQAEKYELFTKAITRAHGKSHPEAFDVRELYQQIHQKTEAAGEAKPELNEEFTKLRDVTNNYKVPADVCETYEAVYEYLAEADKVYQA